MDSLFQKPSAPVVATDVQQVPTATQPVEAKSGEVQPAEERRFTAAETERIVKDRLTREQKKFEKERVEWQSKLTAVEKAPRKDTQVNPHIEEEWRSKLTDAETKTRTLTEQLEKYRLNSLDATIERELLAQGCVDPEVVSDHIKTRNLVHHDDEGNLVVENMSGNLSDLVMDYLSKKPHLKTAETTGGAGTKGPKLSIETLTEKDRLRAQMGATPETGQKLFSKK